MHAAAIEVGRDVANQLVADGADLLATGEMGIGNTTASAAPICAFTGYSPSECTGRGTGIDDEMLVRKTIIVRDGVARTVGFTPIEVLAELGGLEIAALAGYCMAGAELGVPVVVDGVITLAALLVAEALAPGTAGRCVASHRSVEPGATVAASGARFGTFAGPRSAARRRFGCGACNPTRDGRGCHTRGAWRRFRPPGSQTQPRNESGELPWPRRCVSYDP